MFQHPTKVSTPCHLSLAIISFFSKTQFQKYLKYQWLEILQKFKKKKTKTQNGQNYQKRKSQIFPLHQDPLLENGQICFCLGSWTFHEIGQPSSLKRLSMFLSWSVTISWIWSTYPPFLIFFCFVFFQNLDKIIVSIFTYFLLW